MNVAEMLKNVKAECHPITNIDTVIRRTLDRGQKVVASKGPKGGWPWLRMYGYPLTTVADQQEYSLSPLVDTSKILNFRDQDSPQLISPMSEGQFRRNVPGPTSTGNPYLYRVVGMSPVQNQPSAASTLDLVSSSGSDLGDVFVQGLDGSSVLVSEVITLNGTTPVTTTKSYTRVLTLSKNEQGSGYVTVTSDAGATTNVVISANDRHVTHPVVMLFTIPGDIRTLYYDFTLKLPTIYNDDDVSMVPEQYHDSIEIYAKGQIFKHLNNPTMANLLMGEFERRIEDMKQDYAAPRGVFSMEEYQVEPDMAGAVLPAMFPSE